MKVFWGVWVTETDNGTSSWLLGLAGDVILYDLEEDAITTAAAWQRESSDGKTYTHRMW